MKAAVYQSFFIFGILLLVGASLEAQVKLGNVDDASWEMADYLVSHSPFSGKWRRGPNNGDIDIGFSIEGNELRGQILRGTRTPRDFTGPVSHLTIKNNILEFNSITGSRYKLERAKGEKEGWLVGTALSGHADIEVKPSPK